METLTQTKYKNLSGIQEPSKERQLLEESMSTCLMIFR